MKNNNRMSSCTPAHQYSLAQCLAVALCCLSTTIVPKASAIPPSIAGDYREIFEDNFINQDPLSPSYLQPYIDPNIWNKSTTSATTLVTNRGASKDPLAVSTTTNTPDGGGVTISAYTDSAEVPHSGRLDSAGLFHNNYGYYEASIRWDKFDSGTAGAFWLMPSSTPFGDIALSDILKPKSGVELDIIELRRAILTTTNSYGPDVNGKLGLIDVSSKNYFAAIWDGYTSKQNAYNWHPEPLRRIPPPQQITPQWVPPVELNTPNPASLISATTFHTYGLAWTPTTYTLYFDDNKIFEGPITDPTDPIYGGVASNTNTTNPNKGWISEDANGTSGKYWNEDRALNTNFLGLGKYVDTKVSYVPAISEVMEYLIFSIEIRETNLIKVDKIVVTPTSGTATTYEAENAQVPAANPALGIDVARTANCVTGLNYKTEYINWTGVNNSTTATTGTLKLYYTNFSGHDVVEKLIINNNNSGAIYITLPSDSSSWTDFSKYVTVPVNLLSGNNTVKLVPDIHVQDYWAGPTPTSFKILGDPANPKMTVDWVKVYQPLSPQPTPKLDQLTNLPTTPNLPATINTSITINAENYDDGGEGVAYFDMTNSNVDIVGTADQYVSDMVQREWLKYTLTPSSGYYAVELNASPDRVPTSNIHAAIDGLGLGNEQLDTFSTTTPPAPPEYPNPPVFDLYGMSYLMETNPTVANPTTVLTVENMTTNRFALEGAKFTYLGNHVAQYQESAATLANGATTGTPPNSNPFISGFQWNGSGGAPTATFNNVDGGNGGSSVLLVRYAANIANPKIDVIVNGTTVVDGLTNKSVVSPTNTIFNPKNNINNNSYAFIPVTTTAGNSNNIVFRSVSGSQNMRIDWIALGTNVPVATGYFAEAESGTLAGGTSINNNTNYASPAGAGKIVKNFVNSGASVTWSGITSSGGAKTLTIYYTRFGTPTQPLTLLINGVPMPVAFPVTGTWTQPIGSISVSINMLNSANNTIKLQGLSTSDDINCDRITVSP